jgi:N-acetylglucosamine repressor
MSQVGRGSHRPLVGMNSVTVRQQNRSTVFEAIRHYAPISRKVLASHTGLNPATVTHIVDDLLGAELVIESGIRDEPADDAFHRRSGGRKEIGLAINADAFYLVGVNLTRTRTTVVVTNLAAEILVDERFEVSFSHSMDMRVDRVLEMIERAISRSGVPHSRLRGIGVGAPGPLNTKTGTILASTFEGWVGVPLKELLEQRFGLPVTIDNDANTAALAEQWFGAGKELANFAFVAVGAGVGAGIIVDGHLFLAGGDLNPEFGHTTVQVDGPRCACGNRGCLEVFTATPNLVRRTIEAMQRGNTTILAPLLPIGRRLSSPPDPLHEDFDALTPERIWAAVEAGDKLATAVVRDAGTHLAGGLANLVALFHPSTIFIGHDMAKAGPRTFEMLREAMLDVGVPECIPVLPSTIGESVPALGAVTLALRELFGAPGL